MYRKSAVVMSLQLKAHLSAGNMRTAANKQLKAALQRLQTFDHPTTQSGNQ